ncbi:MAG: AMP-dependent synthetase [Planctomycetaceae bacterium]|nr:AMP-dependent synthetase [Planctomycetaceae bacterium]
MIDLVADNPTRITNLVDLLRWRAAWSPNQVAYTFRVEGEADQSVTYGELDRTARALAVRLAEVTKSGDRALLLFPAGLDFVRAFFGSAYARCLAVPSCYPKPHRPMPRLSAIANDARAVVVLTESRTFDLVETARETSDLGNLDWIKVDELDLELADQWQPARIDSDEVLFLQYTSGSTDDPKGVMVQHRNVLHNLEVIRRGFHLEFSHRNDTDSGKGVFWLPAYHDMGLIGGILTSMYVGGQTLLMSPNDFLRRPARWLEAISQQRALVSGAPNFAYDLCVQKITEEQIADLDLSSWKVGFCGAEPIRPETLEQFAAKFETCGFCPEAFYPCYGLAESTLLAAGGDGPSSPVVRRYLRSALAQHRVTDANGAGANEVVKLVGCGSSRLEQRLEIVHPENRLRCDEDEVGEIWLQSPSIAAGYWNRPEETEEVFNAQLQDGDQGSFLRTGDLGFVHEGQLFVTGRVKEVIIIRGRNLYPQDVEKSVARAHPSLRNDAGATFSLTGSGEERLIVVHEIDRAFRRTDLNEVVHQIRRAIIDEHEVDPHAIVLIRQVSLPMTTSGKVQRSLCRQQYLEGTLRVLEFWKNETSLEQTQDGPSEKSIAPVVATSTVNGNGRQETRETPSSNNNGETSSSSTNRLKTAPLQLEDRPLTADERDRLSERIEIWLMDWLEKRASVSRDQIHRDKPFAEYGLDSLTAVEMSQDIEDWLGVQVTATVAWNYPTSATMSRYLVQEVAGSPEQGATPTEFVASRLEMDFDRLLGEVENLTEEEVESLLTQQEDSVVESRYG